MGSNSILEINNVWQKLSQVEEDCQRALSAPSKKFLIPELPARDVEFLPISMLPPKLGLSTDEGRQKLLHDLANIELQAMELGLRTLMEFPYAHRDFREQLVAIVLEEAKHLRMCLQGIEHLGGYWGKWPVHMGLYCSVDRKDSLLERIFIVHRYLESSGLDAGDTILRRLSGVPQKIIKEVVDTIVNEEIGHVEFGSRWFNHYCRELFVDELEFFTRKTRELLSKNPRPGKLANDLRRKAGFSNLEINTLKNLKNEIYLN